MLWGIAVLGIWLFQKSFYPNIVNQYLENEHGEKYNPETGTWQLPKVDSGITIDKWDDAVIGLVLLGIILFSKPWK
jgi:hypothetical protein